ncbi:MAG: two-component system response regulator [Gammaproteobacteria bacterium]|nr:MAG: two-component system response regulator [Gammaproteobacteria bacterium]
MSANILIVDDEPNIVLSLEYLMKKAGYTVRTAVNGEQALRDIEQQRPDLVLLDVMMPRVNGYAVCHALRENPDYRGIRILMLTARGRQVEQEKGMALGADGYVTKPFSTRALLDRVQALLDEPR